MAKFFAWLLFLASSAAFVYSLAHQQTIADNEEACYNMGQPLPDMVRFQQACAADDSQ